MACLLLLPPRSDCGPEARAVYLAQLAEFVAIESHGKCWRTHGLRNNLAHASSSASRYREKAQVSARYPFYLAFENTLVDGYVTEKFWQASVAGACAVQIKCATQTLCCR